MNFKRVRRGAGLIVAPRRTYVLRHKSLAGRAICRMQKITLQPGPIGLRSGKIVFVFNLYGMFHSGHANIEMFLQRFFQLPFFFFFQLFQQG